MLIHDQMEFHNVTALVEKPGLPGLAMQRFPDYARESVNRDVADICRSVEIRFYLEEDKTYLDSGKVYLLARSGPGEAVVFYGDYQSIEVIPLDTSIHSDLQNLTAVHWDLRSIHHPQSFEGSLQNCFRRSIDGTHLASKNTLNMFPRFLRQCFSSGKNFFQI